MYTGKFKIGQKVKVLPRFTGVVMSIEPSRWGVYGVQIQDWQDGKQILHFPEFALETTNN